jgi:hypothetical protein
LHLLLLLALLYLCEQRIQGSSAMSPEQLHSNICDFIKRWRKPPGLDHPKSLRMLSEFASCAGLKLVMSMPEKSDESKDAGTP